jgi:ankyrin repeat protein
MFGYSLLYYAVRSGHEEVVECLLKLGCSLNLEGQLSTSVHCAAYYGHRNILLRLIREGSPTNIRNSKGHLPIEEAAN